MANYKLNITSFKVLNTIYILNEQSYYPLIEGVKKIVNGAIDEDTIKFKNIDTFSTLTSIKGRRLASIIHQLVRYNYLTYIHNKIDDQMYLKITFKGESNIEDYLKHHKVTFKKNNIKENKPTIVYIK